MFRRRRRRRMCRKHCLLVSFTQLFMFHMTRTSNYLQMLMATSKFKYTIAKRTHILWRLPFNCNALRECVWCDVLWFNSFSLVLLLTIMIIYVRKNKRITQLRKTKTIIRSDCRKNRLELKYTLNGSIEVQSTQKHVQQNQIRFSCVLVHTLKQWMQFIQNHCPRHRQRNHLYHQRRDRIDMIINR